MTPPLDDARRNRMLGLVMSGLSLLVCGVGGYVVQLGAAPVQEIATAEGLSSVEPPAFVRLQVTPRLDTVSEISEGASRHFLVQTEQGALLYAGAGTDLGRDLAAAMPRAPGAALDPAAIATARQPRVVEGACYVLGDYSRLTTTLPGDLVDDYAEDQALPAGTRVIEVDHGPLSVMAIGGLSIGCCALPLFGLALYALVRSRRK